MVTDTTAIYSTVRCLQCGSEMSNRVRGERDQEVDVLRLMAIFLSDHRRCDYPVLDPVEEV